MVSAVVDTNLVVSGLLRPRGDAYDLLEAWRAGAFVLLLSPSMYDEYADVLPRPKFARYRLTPEIIARFLDQLAAEGRFVTPSQQLPLSVRDPKDEHVLATALGGQADYLVTGDRDLLALRGRPELGRLQIVTVKEFLAVLARETPGEEPTPSD